MTTTIFPPDHLVTAALEALLDEAQRSLNVAIAEDADKEEKAFWRRQRNAFVNAEADWLQGRRPTETPTGYLLPSASRPGAFHRAWRAGDVWCCSCEAGEAGLFHRHTALICAIERAADLAETHDDPGPGDYERAQAEVDELFAY
jgi:hypothetical protein